MTWRIEMKDKVHWSHQVVEMLFVFLFQTVLKHLSHCLYETELLEWLSLCAYFWMTIFSLLWPSLDQLGSNEWIKE